MKSKINDNSTKSFEVTIPSTAILASYQKQLQKVASTAELKGFRKGKAPLELVERGLDKSKIYSQVLDQILPPAYVDGLKKHNLIPLSEPRITPLKMEEQKDWTFKVEVAVKPEFELGDYQKFVKKALEEHAKSHKHEKPQDEKAQAHEKEHTLGVVFDSLLKNIQFSVSKILIEDESKNALSRLVNQLSTLKLSVDDYLKSIKKTKEELIKEYEETALTNLRLEFILQAIVADLKLEVEEKDPYKKYLAQKRLALDFLVAL